MAEIVSGDFDEKKTTIADNIQKRTEERLLNLQKRKEEKENLAADDERQDVFEQKFSRAIIEVEEGLKKCDSLDKNGMPAHFDQLSTSVQQVQKFLSDSTFFLSAHRINRSQEAITKLQNAIQEKRDTLLPKKKFAFKSKKKAAEKPKPTNGTDTVDRSKAVLSNPIISQLTDTCLSDKSGETLAMSQKELYSSDVTLARLADCTVKLYGSPSTVHMSNLQNCSVFCGPVSGSIFVDDCVNCTFVVACQQLRVHTTKNSSFYLHVTSRAIIEDCNGLEFAPYNLKYPDIDEHYGASGLDQARNSWDDVDDFNWLASDAHSPNWTVLEESRRKSSWDI